MDDRRVVIVGAGLAGCLLATLLGRRGIEVSVYERRGDPRASVGHALIARFAWAARCRGIGSGSTIG